MGISKDLKKYINELQPYSLVYTDSVTKRLNEILREDKERKAQKKLRNEYIAVKQQDFKDDGDTFEALKDGHGLPPIGYKYVKVWR